MTKSVVLVFAALAAGASQAGWESWLKSSIYGASFESYEKDQELSNLGTTNGTWGALSDVETRAAANSGPGQYIKFSTGSSGLVFTPETTGNRALKSVMASAQLSAYEEYPSALSDNPRGAFAIYAPKDGATNFVGWTAGGWVDLQSTNVVADPEQWYDISMKFVQTDETVRVQYRLKRQEDVNYATLHAVGDPAAVWFKAGAGSSDAIVSEIEFLGEGAFSCLSGSEPRRGLLIGLVPWREMLIDESVYHQGTTGDWYVFDYEAKQANSFPVVVGGDAYGIYVPEGESYTGFKPKEQGSEGREVIEFTVRFVASNDNDAAPADDACALVRLVEMPMTDIKKVGLDYRFACLANGNWHTNLNIKADVDADYTVEVTLDKDEGTVNYRIREGLGGEAGLYESLLPDGIPVKVSIGDPLFAFFGGLGKVYSIKSSKPTAE